MYYILHVYICMYVYLCVCVSVCVCVCETEIGNISPMED